MKHWVTRNYWWLVLFLLPLWPLRTSLATGEIPGAGPDVLSTLWGMWWFGQEWLGAAWGGWTGLANGGLDSNGRAFGAYGSVLSPLSATVWNVLEPIVGIGRSMALVGALQLGGFGCLYRPIGSRFEWKSRGSVGGRVGCIGFAPVLLWIGWRFRGRCDRAIRPTWDCVSPTFGLLPTHGEFEAEVGGCCGNEHDWPIP